MHSLVLHPSCAPGPVDSIGANVTRAANGCEIEFKARGAISQIVVPGSAPSRRADGLWKSTCFEMFWQAGDERRYREFNLSPSGEWAAYGFAGVRAGMHDAPVDSLALLSSHDGSELVLRASIAAALGIPARIGLCAVIEDSAGVRSYWALCHAKESPDFHDPSCFTARLS